MHLVLLGLSESLNFLICSVRLCLVQEATIRSSSKSSLRSGRVEGGRQTGSLFVSLVARSVCILPPWIPSKSLDSLIFSVRLCKEGAEVIFFRTRQEYQ